MRGGAGSAVHRPAIVRLTLFAAAVSVVTLVWAPAAAACVAPPARSSPDGRARIRVHPLIVWGRIGGDIPQDVAPHGAYTFTLTVRRYFAGSGPQTITITSYGDLDLHQDFHVPNNRTSLEATVDFLRRYAGAEGIFFLTPRDTAQGRDTGRYALGYATTGCLYNVVGAGDVALLVPLLEQIFRGPAPTGTAAPTPAEQPTAVPTGSLPPRASAKPSATSDDRAEHIVRAGALALLVAAALLLYRSPRSPLFEGYRRS